MILDNGDVICDGMPTMYGCHAWIKPKRKWSAGEGRRNGWLVTHAVDDHKGTPSVPLFIIHFCPSCAEIVLAQDEADDLSGLDEFTSHEATS